MQAFLETVAVATFVLGLVAMGFFAVFAHGTISLDLGWRLNAIVMAWLCFTNISACYSGVELARSSLNDTHFSPSLVLLGSAILCFGCAIMLSLWCLYRRRDWRMFPRKTLACSGVATYLFIAIGQCVLYFKN